MKLALMALVIEICLARVFAGSWQWAIAIALIYCSIVYIHMNLLIKNQDKNKSVKEFKGTNMIPAV